MPRSNVLIVDHSPSRSDILSTLLLNAGYIVYQAHSPTQALNWLQQENIDILIISDSLPDTNLQEVCIQIKSTTATREVAILIYFHLKDKAATIVKALNNLIDGYLSETHQEWEILFMLEKVEGFRGGRKQLRRKEQLLKQLNSFIPGALFQFKMDKKGHFSLPHYSARMSELFEMPAQQVESNLEKLFEKIHPEDRAPFWQSIQASAQSLQPWLLNYRIIKSSSQEILWIRGHSFPRKGADGSIIWHGLLIDITDIKKAEETLRIQSRAIEHAAEGIIITNPHLEDNPIIFVNEKFLQDTGYSKEEIMEKNCRFLQGKDTDREMVDGMREAIKSQMPFSGEVLNYKKDGTPFWAFLVIAPVVDEQARLTHFVGLMNDITLRKEAELKLLQQNELLKKMNSELDRFVYSVSHNLRAPLTSLLGLISISQLTEDISQRDVYLGHMENSIHKLDATIQEINDYAKNVRLELQVEKLDFHRLIEEVKEGLTFMEEAKGIQIGVDIKGAHDFYSDRSRLQVVLTNLLSNAIKYSDRSKEKPFIQINLQVGSDLLHLSIKDNGMGIGEEHQEKIFSMFYRATATSKGSGLGLYIVQENITKMKGSIRLISALHQGSEFIIHLPNLQPNRSHS